MREEKCNSYISKTDQELSDIMIVPGQYIKIKWNPNNRKYYESIGYTFTSCKDWIEVPAELVTHGSKETIQVECDYCHKIFTKTIDNYYSSIKESNESACKDCGNIKMRETMKTKYGVVAAIQSPRFAEKIKRTNIKKYGTECSLGNKEVKEKASRTMRERYGAVAPFHVQQFKEKAKNTIIKKYGVNNVLQSPEIQNKIKKTCLEKYGVDNPAKSDGVIKKAKKTCVERYGGESSQSSPEVRHKSWETMINNGTIPSSKAEKEMVALLIEMYGEENCFPSYPFDKVIYDCLLVIGDVKIDVEFDGYFWHKNKKEQDKRRDFYSMRKGIKVLRFLSKGNVPTKEQIKQGVQYLVDTEHHYLRIDI